MICKLSKLTLYALISSVFFFACDSNSSGDKFMKLSFDNLSKTWDEAMPLGNGEVGALIWQKDNKIRFSLDRIDLWDLRTMANRDNENFNYKKVFEHVEKGDYAPIQRLFDAPYEALPAPSKIPGAALEFGIESMGDIVDNTLDYSNGVCEVEWSNGTKLKSFVHATKPIGWIIVENAPQEWMPNIIPPSYQKEGGIAKDNAQSGPELSRLGYSQGTIETKDNTIVYEQEGWNGFNYQVAVKWEKDGDKWIGVWSVTSSMIKDKAIDLCNEAIAKGLDANCKEHNDWWGKYWSKSSISIPDSLIYAQYINEKYKFGSIARENGYPISLQAVWTADNGKLPPWKGDYHHDLNTQLSYWHCYAANNLEEGMGYLNTLWDQRETNKKYTKEYFGTTGLNVPGVTTLDGEPMGGWIQYSCSPTISAWLSQHFYLQWRYSADTSFLKDRAYPYMSDVAKHLQEITFIKDGQRQLPISSSPEINDNSINAWFRTWTNYDLALCRFVFEKSSEMARVLSLNEQAEHWDNILEEFPSYNLDDNGAMTFAENTPYRSSHRHFSHLMAIHPLSVIDMSDGAEAQSIIKSTIADLYKYTPDYWTGYSYSWLANLEARAFNGEKAAEALHDFAYYFVLRNGFHVNGDQKKAGKSKFTYRPFTLEGNFAFAAGVQEMLIQSHTDTINIFPAIPASWTDVSFEDLRCFGAFLVSAVKKDGEVTKVVIKSEKGGKALVRNPFKNKNYDDVLVVDLKPGESVELSDK